MIKKEKLSINEVAKFFLYGICEDDYHPLWASVASVYEKAMRDAIVQATDIVSSYLEERPECVRVYLSDNLFAVDTRAMDPDEADDKLAVLSAYAALGTIPPIRFKAHTVGVSLVYSDILVGCMRETGDNTRLSYGLPSPRRFFHTGLLSTNDKKNVRNPLMVIAAVAQMAAIISAGMKGDLDPHSLGVAQRNVNGVVDSLSGLQLVATNQQPAEEHPFMF